jgi:hypothetical protein
MTKLRAAETQDIRRVKDALAALKVARREVDYAMRQLADANSPRAQAKAGVALAAVRKALTSAGGAERHMERRVFATEGWLIQRSGEDGALAVFAPGGLS